MTLYFAYGSNMSREPMRRRCPGAKELGTAVLHHHRFIIMANSYGSVVPAPGMNVHGVLWDITPRDLAALDAYENMDAGLYRHAMLPVFHGALTVSALIYLGCETREGQPPRGYIEGVVEAAREWKLPPEYIATLARWSPGGWRGTDAPDAGDMH